VAMDQAAMGASFQSARCPRQDTGQRPVHRPAVIYAPTRRQCRRYRRALPDRVAAGAPTASGLGRYARRLVPNAVAWAREGGIPAATDYIELGETLFRGLRRDFTFLTRALVDRCVLDGRQLVLNNAVNRERYDVLFVPGADTLSLAAAQKIHDFWAAGGTVIATGCLPSKSAELGHDRSCAS